jgi:hypothetical protein
MAASGARQVPTFFLVHRPWSVPWMLIPPGLALPRNHPSAPGEIAKSGELGQSVQFSWGLPTH